ncbi:MAG: hypothetical protein ABMA13_04355 [Chthoniobacteraceae bacterium]
MKLRTTVWTLSWDTDTGTDCRVFGSQAEWFAFFRGVIESSIRDIHTSKADAIRAALVQREVGLAYELWQQSYKPQLDTYNWVSHELDVEVSPVAALVRD